MWRLLDQLGGPELTEVAAARAAAREVIWAQRAEVTGSQVHMQLFTPVVDRGTIRARMTRSWGL